MPETTTPTQAPLDANGQTDAEPPEPARTRAPRRTEGQSATREYVVYEENEEGTVRVVGGTKAHDRDSACWAVVESPGTALHDRAVAAGLGDAKGPRLAAVPLGSLAFEEYALEPVQSTRRVKRG